MRTTSDRIIRRRGLRAFGAALIAVALATAVTSCSLIGGSSPVPTSTATAPTGVEGAVNFTERYIAAGTGATKVDLWFDPMCPICGTFEKANGELLAKSVADGSITLRLHPLTFLDRLSNGTGYSTRAVAALTCVAVNEPDKALEYFQSLYAHQPEENSDGLTNKQLAALATDAAIGDISSCLSDSGPYQAWAQANTAHSQTGPIVVDGAKVLERIEGTPTVLVDGKLFTGKVDDASAFRSFLAGD